MHVAITPLILTHNELPNIVRTLRPLAWASRVVVVDSLSDDGTADAARGFPNVEVVPRAFDTFREQWNFGVDLVETEWVLSLDADYLCGPALTDELGSLAPSVEVSGYAGRFRYCVAGKPLRGTLYPPRVVLFRKARARYVQDGHTQRLAVDGRVENLVSRIDHDDRKPLAAWLRAQQRYVLDEADKLSHTPVQQLSAVDRLRRIPLIVPALTPLYCLLAKGLLLDGWPGIFYTAQRTYAELLLSLHLLERRHAATPR